MSQAKHDHLICKIATDALYPGSLYKIENDGSIWTLKTVAGNISVTKTWRRCDPIGSNGNREVSYVVDGKRYRLQANRIVYRYWKGLLDENQGIYHLDHDKSNNYPGNLQQGLQAEINLHQFRNGHRKPVVGNSRFTANQIKEIREAAKEGLQYWRIALAFETSKGHISDIVNKKIWKNV